MKQCLMVLGFASLMLGLVSSSKAHVGDRVFPVFELTDEDIARIDVR